ncbi:hypothetical protein BC629DRAFT_602804 [Irpex lacteus]|nr:hypothetical protein BC629DRAFT_602804 [Irpex lacteus]
MLFLLSLRALHTTITQTQRYRSGLRLAIETSPYGLRSQSCHIIPTGRCRTEGTYYSAGSVQVFRCKLYGTYQICSD